MSGDITITSNSFYTIQQCLNYSDGFCTNYITYIPEQTVQNYFNSLTESNSSVVSYGCVLILFIRLIKGIFRLILPSKGK